MKIVVSELSQGNWVIKGVSSVASSVGRTTYPTKEAAIAEAARLYPGQDVTVE